MKTKKQNQDSSEILHKARIFFLIFYIIEEIIYS